MNSSRAEESTPLGWGLEELQLLSALGFGPDSVLMSEPKLFVDSGFLAALQRELHDELGAEEAERTLFHIGLIHGLRDATRVSDVEPGRDGLLPVVECPPLAMRFGSQKTTDGILEVAGAWPDHFESEARLSKLGTGRHPACALSAGYTSGWLSGTLDRDVVAVERTCRVAGDECCSFVARDEAAWRDGSEGYDERRLSVAALRAVACEMANAGDPAYKHGSFSTVIAALPSHLDPEDPAIHIWGPVMVMPFAGPEIALQTLETLGRDEATRAVRVVVLDLCAAVLDEGFGAAALENLIEDIQSWGAEVILTGISPLSEDVIAELQANLLLCRKDLPEAIAYAFQIAEAQRHLL